MRQSRWFAPRPRDISRCDQPSCKGSFHRGVVGVSLPPKGEARDRWLARCEAAALIWDFCRLRERQPVHSGMSKGNRVNAYRPPLRHIARFILIALYILELGPARLPR